MVSPYIELMVSFILLMLTVSMNSYSLGEINCYSGEEFKTAYYANMGGIIAGVIFSTMIAFFSSKYISATKFQGTISKFKINSMFSIMIFLANIIISSITINAINKFDKKPLPENLQKVRTGNIITLSLSLLGLILTIFFMVTGMKGPVIQ